jgi:uncharacterized membrane protein
MHLNRKTIIIFLLILVVGFAIRFTGLEKESLWYDEFYSLKTSRGGMTDIINAQKNDAHPPLYYLLLNLWSYIFGENEWGLRSFSAFIGAFTIVLLFFSLRSLTGDNVGLISCLLFALAPFHIYYSQEVRMYALLAFMTMSCIYFTTKILNSITYRDLVGLMISEVATLYTHNYGLFVIATLNIYMAYLIFVHQEDVAFYKFWIVLQIAVLVFYAPWIPILIKQIEAGGASPYATSYAHLSKLPGLLVVFFLVGFPWYHQFKYIIFILVALGIFFGAFNFKKTKKEYILSIDKGKKHLFVIALFIVPVSLIFFTGIFMRIYSTRSLIIILIPICILLGLGINKFRLRSQIIIIIFYFVITSLSIYNLYQHPQKEQWREVARYIDRNAQSTDVTIVCADFMKQVFNHYSEAKMSTIGIKRSLDRSQLKAKIEPIVRKHDRTWLILSHAFGSPIKLYMVDENKQTTLIEHKLFLGVDIFLLERINSM